MQEINGITYSISAESEKYCKEGNHRLEPLNIHGDMQCVECGYMEHICDLQCMLHPKKCNNPKNLKLPSE